jgi:hypothetical protein
MQGEKLEVVAMRYALESWLREGAAAGALGPPLAATSADPSSISAATVGAGQRLGVSVIGVSNLDQLDEILRVLHSIIDGLETGPDDTSSGDDSSSGLYGHYGNEDSSASTHCRVEDLLTSNTITSNPLVTLTLRDGITDRQWSHLRRRRILALAKGIREVIGPEWVNYTWASPGEGFVNIVPEHSELVDEDNGHDVVSDAGGVGISDGEAIMLTPPPKAMDK